MTMAEGWTIPQAREELARTGLPIDRLADLLGALPGFPRLGEERKKPGSAGGRGYKLYPIGDLQHLHGFLARNGWLDKPASGDTRP